MSPVDIDNLCKQFGTRSEGTKHQAWSGSKLYDTLRVFLKYFYEKLDFQKKLADDKKAWKVTQHTKSKNRSN